jgi:pyruvate,water dikinase
MDKKNKLVLSFDELFADDVKLVGGKNASLGEMFSKLTKKGVNIPDGFALTSKAYWYYLKENGLDKKLKNIFKKLNPKKVSSIQKVGKKAREAVLSGELPEDLKREVIQHYKELSKKYNQKDTDVAVRSSATAEDSKDASFAGQMETYLNVRGDKELFDSIKKCMSSFFTDRSISYREEKGYGHLDIALSVGVQKMVRSDLASSGIMFSIDTESGFENAIIINSIFGIGELIVKGRITPDEFCVFKPNLKNKYKSIIQKTLGKKTEKYIYGKNGGLKSKSVTKKDQLRFSLTEEEVLTLAQWAYQIEKHYNYPQDIEWAKDGKTGELFVVQSRPETVHSFEKEHVYREYQIKTDKKPIIEGISVGNKVGFGKVNVIANASELNEFKEGEVLVTTMTDPDWVPIMRMASAIITDKGGKTAHAAIVSRELGVPCIVGSGNATEILKDGQEVTVDCTQGRVFEGKVPFKVEEFEMKKKKKLPSKIVLNLGAPETAFQSSFLPVEGVGLAREEFIIAEKIRIHPLALYHYNKIKDKKIKKKIDELTVGYKDKKKYFIEKLREGISTIAAAFHPKDVIIRLSDFKTNEYATLIGGEEYEKEESNPMLGWRGASRYYDDKFKPAFKMECQAIKEAREDFGLKNIWIMIPFCRTVEEGKKVLKLMKEYGLERGKDGLKIIVMCEIPSNIILAEEFLEYFDGMSIGSNDLTQLVLGMDRDNADIASISDERDPAVKEMIRRVIRVCRKKKKYIGICGEAPSYYPEFAQFLLDEKITAISLNPGTVLKTLIQLNK